MFAAAVMVAMALVGVLVVVLSLVLPAPAARADAEFWKPADPASQGEVDRLFSQAQAAISAGNGEALLPLLSRDSRARLEAVRLAARAGGEAGLSRFSPAEKVAVLTLQRFLSPAELRHLTAADMVEQALARHWLKPAHLADGSLGPLTLDGDRAEAPLLVKDKPSLVTAAFVRDGGPWRIDLTRSVALADGVLRLFAALAGKTEDAYAADLVNRLHPPHKGP